MRINKIKGHKLPLNVLLFFTLNLFLITFWGCEKYNNHPAFVLREQREKSGEKTKEQKIDESLLKSNQVISEKETQQINGYIQRRKWDMKRLNNGIYIQVLTLGNGTKVTDSSIVKLDYKLELINGKQVYSSSTDGQKIVKFNSSENEVGLLYALKTLTKGSKARVIIPQYYGFGLYGDGKKIPKHATLVYELEVKDVK